MKFVVYGIGGTQFHSADNVIQYVTIQTTGHAKDFGDLIQMSIMLETTCSSTTRGVCTGMVMHSF